MTANDYSATKIMAMVSEKHETEKELNELVSAQNGMYNRATADRIKNLHQSVDTMRKQIDTELAKPAGMPPILEQPYNPFEFNQGRTSNEYRKNFIAAVREGFKVANTVGYLNGGALSDGGYLLPVEFEKSIVSALENENVMRQICRVILTESTHKITIIANKPAASWIGEGQEISLANTAFTQKSLDAYKLAVAIKCSNEVLQDAFINLEDFLSVEFSAALARAEEDAYLNGTGEDNQPTGLLPTLAASATGTLQTTSTTLSADDLTTLIYSVDRPYRRNACFLLNDATLAQIRKLKDSNQNYLWTQNLTSSEPPQLLGFPVYTSNYMPAPTAGNIAVLFGDFSKVVIGDRGVRTFRPLRELFALSDCTAFLMTERTDCVLTDNKAIRGLKIRVS